MQGIEDPKHVRDRQLGRKIRLTAHIHMITKCNLAPRCNYCSLSSSDKNVRSLREVLSEREFVNAIKYASSFREISSLTLVGGSDLLGQDSTLINIVKAARKITDIDIMLDVGAFISPQTLSVLREEGVVTIYSSVETCDKTLFKEAKPGDSFDMRIQLLETAGKLGFDLGTVVMNGIGEMADALQSIRCLSRFESLKYIYISTFKPVIGTPWEKRKGASVLDSLNIVGEARLLFPWANIGLADVEVEGESIAPFISRELESGAGNVLAGMLIYKNHFSNYIDAMKLLRNQGYEILMRE